MKTIVVLVMMAACMSLVHAATRGQTSEARGGQERLKKATDNWRESLDSLLKLYGDDIEKLNARINDLAPLVKQGVVSDREIEQLRLQITETEKKRDDILRQMKEADALSREIVRVLPPAPTSKPSPPAPRPELMGDRLPRGFRGDSFNTVFNTVARAYRPKGEFESTEEYANAVFSKIPSSTFAFLIPQTVSDSSYLGYDADTETLMVTLPLTQVFKSERMTGKRRFLARTVLNVPFWVTSYRYEQEFLNFAGKSLKLEADIPMSRAEARRVKPNLAILVIGELDRASFPAGEDSTFANASLDDPVAVTTYWRSLCLTLRSIVVFNTVTGEVVLRRDGTVSSPAVVPAFRDISAPIVPSDGQQDQP